MGWMDELVDDLARAPRLGYAPSQAPATEPTALAALALLAHGRAAAAEPALDWLLEQQAADGSIGVRAGETEPKWPTALAILAWRAASRVDARNWKASLESPLKLARQWLLDARGATYGRDPEMGHDTTLVAWPWVEGTHSWVEPTALSVLALRALGDADHARVREAVRLLFDRLLLTGGANYGNTEVLGRSLRPHLLPTGMTLAALYGERDTTGRLARSRAYVERAIDERTLSLSLAWSIIGLTLQGVRPTRAESLLERAWERTRRGGVGIASWTQAPLALAAANDLSSWLTESAARAVDYGEANGPKETTEHSALETKP